MKIKRCHGCCGVYKSDVEASDCYNRQYHSNWKEHEQGILTEDGIILIDGITCEYIRTIPNDDRVVRLLREAISLWKQGDIDKFVALTDDWYRMQKNKEVTVEEGFIFKGTKFLLGDKNISLYSILEELSIKKSQ